MNRTLKFSIFLALLLFGTVFSQQENKSEIKKAVKVDSLLDTYSIEEILKFREYYQQQLDGIEKEKIALREKGISDAEKFIRENPDSKVLDRVLMRLAELYYEKVDDDFIVAMQEYDRLLEEMDNSGVDTSISEPKRDHTKPLQIYEKIIKDFPHSNLIDDAFYNKGFILEEIGEKDSAFMVYESIIRDFPESRYVPDAMMRIAEYYFNPPQNEIYTAIDYYKRILNYKNSPKYDEALYRLGWSYYRLTNYTEAVSYFTLLVDDINRTNNVDFAKSLSNPDLRDEALEYIGLSFLDSGGLQEAVEYIQSINTPAYGFDILKKIGDVYMNEKEEYENAVATYSKLLKMYPENNDAPEINEKIVNCYRFLGNDRLTYLTRDKLFNQYKPGSPWWLKNESKEVRDKAYRITERVLRDNITLLFQQADFNDDQSMYNVAVNDCKKYLKVFPDDSSSPRIHWNMALTMDTKLKQYDAAFEEYMKICDLYWKSKYQRYAAENAIALGRDAVEADTTIKRVEFDSDEALSVKKIESGVLSAFNFRRMEPTDSEKKLMRSYNNYIKLYPHEKNTIRILNNAGALHFNNNRFKEALRYFNTIVKHFPEYEDIHYTKYQILESYFGRGDYKSAEIVSRRLKDDPEAPGEIVEKARRRLAESIFLAAKVYADSSDHLQAGNEYLRVLQEVPDAEFIELSLFNAACEYDKAREYSRAVETYNYLIETRENSKYKFDAMNNLAIDYGELFEYKNAALTYERLAHIAGDTTQIHDAMYNSSLFFVKAEEWEDAIRINSRFVENFPESEDADDLFFDIATYYLRLDKLEEANRVYGEYANRFPDSPRVIETFFHRGKYYDEKKEYDLAISEYEKAVSKNDEFEQRGLETNDYFAAEALSNAVKIKYDEFRNIEFNLPLAKMEQDRNQKRDMLIDIVDGYTRVASYGTVHLYEATYNIGRAYEEFADTWARQEIPPMERTRRIITQKEVNETTVELYGKAEDSYRQSIDVLKELADKYEQSLFESDSSKIPEAELKKIVSRDSTLHIARRWIDRSEERMSKVIYDMAELNMTTIDDLLSAPVPDDLDKVALMEYHNQILQRAIRPLIDDAVNEHVRNVKESWRLGIENQWVKISRKKVVTTNNVLAREYEKLTNQALDLYGETAVNYEKVIKDGGVTEEGFDAVALLDQQAALIDFSKEFTQITVDVYQQTLNIAETENIEDPSVALTEENLFKDVFEFAIRCDSLARLAYSNKKKYEKLFIETNNRDYEDAFFGFEDNYFSIKENTLELLENTYQLSKDIGIENRWSRRVQLALVEVNPGEFCSTLGLEVQTKEAHSDLSWLTTNEYFAGWTNPELNAEQWKKPEFVDDMQQLSTLELPPIWLSKMDTVSFDFDTTYVAVFDSNNFTMDFDSLLQKSAKHDSSENDTMSIKQNKKMIITSHPNLKKVRCKRVYFRKSFNIPGLPVGAEIRFKIDDSYNIFLNGEYISAFVKEDSTVQKEHTLRFSDGLVSGENVLAIEGFDSDNSGGGFVSTLSISSLPGWEEKKRQILFETSDKKIKENLAMDKYIILY